MNTKNSRAICRRMIQALFAIGLMSTLGIATAQFTLPGSRPATESVLQNPAATGGAANLPVAPQMGNAARPSALPRGGIGTDGLPVADDFNRTGTRPYVSLRDEPPSQFQQFVQEATGKLLPIFGAELFESSQGFVPDAGLATPANYVLGPGDEVRIQVWGPFDFASVLVIDRDGQVVLPKVGALQLSGVQSGNLENVVKNHLSRVFTNFGVSASLGKLRTVQVYVVGQARQPGAYAVSSLSTLVNVLFVSGGPNTNGSMRAIELRRAGKVLTRLDLYDLISKGDKTADVSVLPGDVIFIPPASRRVAITGAYDQSAIYELSDKGTTVGDILSLGGGASAIASTRKALLERVYPERMPPRQVVDLALDAKGLAQPLTSGDILTLLPVSPAFSNAVTLQGVVAEPLRFGWFEGMRISDLIPDRDALITPAYYRRKNQLALPGSVGGKAEAAVEKGLEDQLVETRMRSAQDQINWDYAVVERMGKGKLVSELIPFNLGQAVMQRDASQNIALQPGDIVTILSHKDIAVPQEKQSRLVRVEGEVSVPGVYQALPGETLPQLIKRVGGLTAQAYVFGTEFSRESVRARQQANLALLVRRLEGDLQGQIQTTVSTGGQDAAGAAAMLQQQRVVLQSQISRLKSLKSSGRLTLELDPSARALAALPALPLEDGDRVYVPSVPGYVAALGAVSNENAMIYKPGKTVGDVVRAAGVTDDAETDSVFVLRADGSVVSKKDRSGLFGGGFDSLPVMPGDTLVVPAKLDRESGYAFAVRSLKDWTQIISNLGIGAAAIKTLRN